MDVHKRRLFQFSLRTLFLIALFTSVACFWLGTKLRVAREQHEAVASLPYGSVWYDFEVNSPELWVNHYKCHDAIGPALGSFNEMPGPKFLHTLLGDDFFINVAGARIEDRTNLPWIRNFPHLRELDLWSSNVSNADLKELLEVPEIQGIDFNATSISDEGLKYVGRLSRLKKLCLSDTDITDIGLSHIAGLNQVELLNLGRTKITDAGISVIAKFKNLQWLDLDGTRIDDSGLRQLELLQNLRELQVSNTAVTPDGLRHFRNALPKCKVQ